MPYDVSDSVPMAFSKGAQKLGFFTPLPFASMIAYSERLGSHPELKSAHDSGVNPAAAVIQKAPTSRRGVSSYYDCVATV